MRMKAKSLITPRCLAPVVLIFFWSRVVSALASDPPPLEPESDIAEQRNSGPAWNIQFDYMHTRAEWEMLKERSYPAQKPLDGPTLAKRQRAAVAQLERAEAGLPQPQPPLTWTNIGPGRIESTARGWGSKNAGRTVSLAIDPINSSHWLIGTADGGIWQTTDAGITWSPRTDTQASLGVDSIAFAPSNPSIVYGSLTFTGLLKSTDGGSTWKLIENNIFAGRGGRAFAVSPNDPNVAVAAVETPWFPDPACGIYRTTNGGLNWTQSLQQSASALVAKPDDFNRQYAAIGQHDGNAANGLYRSTDAGQTWKRITSGGPWGTVGTNLGQISLALSPSQPFATLYAWVQVYDQPNNRWLGQIWKSTNAWDSNPSWTQLPYPDASNPTRFGLAMAVDPANGNDLFVGEQYPWRFQAATQQWTNLLGWPPTGTHVDVWSMKWAGNDLIVTTDGGVFRSSDRGGTWQPLNDELPIVQFYWGALHPTNTNFALVGAQDNASTYYTGTRVWNHYSRTADGMSTAISAANPDAHWLISSYNMSMWRTTDGGSHWDVADTFDHAGSPFFSRFVTCPSAASADIALAGTTKLWRSNNIFTGTPPTWSINSPDLNECPPGYCNGIRAIEFAPSDASCGTYAIAGGERILATTNAGSSWLTLAPVAPLPNAMVTDLAFDPQDARRLYATFSGYNEENGRGPGHLFVCNDITAPSPTWIDISPTLPPPANDPLSGTPLNTPHNAIAIDPSHTTHLYVGTDLGLVISTDGGNTWSPLGPNTIPRVVIWDILINRVTNKVVVFTYGRGAYSGSLPAAGTPMTRARWIREPANPQDWVGKPLPSQWRWLGDLHAWLRLLPTSTKRAGSVRVGN